MVGNFYPSIGVAGMNGHPTGVAYPGDTFWIEREEELLKTYDEWIRDGAVKVLSVDPPIDWPYEQPCVRRKYRDIDWPWGGF